jgi:hypothetical protein
MSNQHAVNTDETRLFGRTGEPAILNRKERRMAERSERRRQAKEQQRKKRKK